MAGVEDNLEKFLNADRILIVACGSPWHAGLVSPEYIFKEFARIPVEVEYASEFRYRNPIINENDVVIAISQSGETADTLAAIKLAKEKGAFVFGVCNVVGSSISRETHSGAYSRAVAGNRCHVYQSIHHSDYDFNFDFPSFGKSKGTM